MKDKINIHLLDFCLPDYFGGHHLPTIPIMVSGTMTSREVCESLEDEINSLYDFLECEYTEQEIDDALSSFKSDNWNDKNFIEYDPRAEVEGWEYMTDDEKDNIEYPCLFFTIGTIENDRLLPALRYVVHK